MRIGPADVITLLLGFAFIALLIASILLALHRVVRKAVAAELRVARGDYGVARTDRDDRS